MNRFMLFIHKTGSPPWFYNFSGKLLPWTWGVFLVLLVAGLYLGLVKAPPDYLQGESARIMYIHVPSAWMAMFCYTAMAAACATALIWKHPLADVAAQATAPIGAGFTAMAPRNSIQSAI